MFTVGHSTHEAEDFVALLRRHAIEALVDVRRFPGSRRHPQFNSEALERTLADAGIEYVHLEGLGGRRNPEAGSPNAGWQVGQFRGYADHMESDEFAAALTRLRELAAAKRTAVMCAEAQWWRCHRRLLSDALLVRGYEVIHIGARGETQAHALTDFAVAEGERLSYPPAQQTLID